MPKPPTYPRKFVSKAPQKHNHFLQRRFLCLIIENPLIIFSIIFPEKTLYRKCSFIAPCKAGFPALSPTFLGITTLKMLIYRKSARCGRKVKRNHQPQAKCKTPTTSQVQSAAKPRTKSFACETLAPSAVACDTFQSRECASLAERFCSIGNAQFPIEQKRRGRMATSPFNHHILHLLTP